MKKRLFIILAIVASLFACQPNNNSTQQEYAEVNGEKIPIIRLDLVDDSATTIPLSALIEEVEIIPLETKPECMIAYCSYMMTDNSILTMARNRLAPIRLYEFDLKGKFIREFGGVGKGPGEHQGYMDGGLTWYPEDELILAQFQGGPVEKHLFNEEGKFIQALSLPWDMGGGVYRFSKDLNMTTGQISGIPKFKRDSFQLVLYRSEGNWVNSFPRRTYPPEGKSGFTIGGNRSLWRYNNVWRLYSAGDDTLYQVSEKFLKPMAIFNFGSSHYMYNQFVEPQTQVGRYSIQILRETERHLYIKKKHLYKLEAQEWSPGQWGSSSYLNYSLILYDKIQNSGYNLRFEDDLLGILPIETIQMNQTWDEFGSVCRIEQAVKVLEWIADAKKNNNLPDSARERILELEKSIDENSNPVMFIYKERNEEEFKSRLEKLASN